MKGRAGGHLNSKIHQSGVDIAIDGLKGIGSEMTKTKIDRKYYEGEYKGDQVLFCIATKTHGIEYVDDEEQPLIGLDHDKFVRIQADQKDYNRKIILLIIEPKLRVCYGGYIDDLEIKRSFMNVDYPIIMNKPKLGGEIIYWNIYKMEKIFRCDPDLCDVNIQLKIQNKADRNQISLF